MYVRPAPSRSPLDICCDLPFHSTHGVPRVRGDLDTVDPDKDNEFARCDRATDRSYPDVPFHDTPSVCHGGGVSSGNVYDSSKSIPWADLKDHVSADSVYHPSVMVDRYELIRYVPVASLEDVQRSVPNSFALEVPLAVVAPRCTTAELRSICNLHDIPTLRHAVRRELLSLVLEHECLVCDAYLPIFVPCSFCSDLQSLVYSQGELDSIASKVKNFSFDVLQTFVHVPPHLVDVYRQGAKLVSISLVSEVGLARGADITVDALCVSAPWLKIASRGSLPVIHFIAKVHGVPLVSRVSKSEALQLLDKHRCGVGCREYRATFIPQSVSRGRRSRKVAVSSDFVEFAPPDVALHPYPPIPFSDRDAADMITAFCDDVNPSRFEESGCSVCGQLRLLVDLVDLADIDCSLDPLIEPGLVRIQRYAPFQRPLCDSGPVLDSTISRACCSSCLASLRKGKRPVHALANGLWLGEVPAVLAQLTFAEQCLVARVRINRCVVRVSSGQSKMMANAVSFPCPTVKVYQLLPPRREELDDVLALIFTGPNAPTEQDLGRTPMLVRRNVVADALNWLKLNHVDYLDLSIDREALDSYPLRGIPVEVVYRPLFDGGNTIPATTGVHDVDNEEGTDAGDCPLKVNGLVGSHLESMSTIARKAAALQHLRTGGHVLAVGRSDTPESIYDNPQLYPQMFPWLFPYGLGGLGNSRVRGVLSEVAHKRWMLMYHDKRFQCDSRFILVAFNHEQIKRGTTGSFVLAKRNNFNTVVNRVSRLNPTVVMSISKRLMAGERVVPCTDDEKTCFALMDQIDHVGGSVQGSLSSKKIMRSELWSLINHRGAPSWFITLSPVDNRHPICIYWADRQVVFNPALRLAAERVRLIARNPVAGARFFHYMVQLLIKHLLGCSSNGVGEGLGIFGKTAAYYGTVEQQGRMTLHLHMLVWVACALSPQEVKDRLMSEDSSFVRDLVLYIEHCQVGEFLTGSMQTVRERFSSEAAVDDPTQTLPSVPPPRPPVHCEESGCDCMDCDAFRRWSSHYNETIDRVLLQSNVHKCYVRRDVVVDGVEKKHVTGKGCLNRDGVCTARFPRAIFQESVVDSRGHINIKKGEAMINSVNKVMSYCFRCNTDCTCLLSGTAVKATVGYVADYIVKMGLKTYQIFSSIYDVFERNPDIWHESKSEVDATRRLVLKMANCLTSKIEIGGPMAAMYLLGNPDHYSSHAFVSFYWRPFFLYVDSVWNDAATFDDVGVIGRGGFSTSFTHVANDAVSLEDDDDAGGDSVVLARSHQRIYASSKVDDYRMRPVELHSVCLFDWVQCCRRVRLSASSSSCLRFADGHPLRGSHGVTFNASRMETVVPNFLGSYLPRFDSEDREYYCCTMMCLFVPWVTGLDLKSSDVTWSVAFDRADFSSRHAQIMRNMNIRYECYDARDDFHSQLRSRIAAQDDDGNDAGEDDDFEHDLLELDPEEAVRFEDEGATGAWSSKKVGQMKDVEAVLYSAGWIEDSGAPDMMDVDLFCPEQVMAASKWKGLLAKERAKVLNAKLRCIPNDRGVDDDVDINFRVVNDARIIPGSYLLSEFRLEDLDVASCMDRVVNSFSLNREQERAFRIVANHSICLSPEPLRMYIGGMGGTGKTQVIKALLEWFECRGEGYRMTVLAPTGAAASIVNGSTYHSYLGVRTGDRRTRGDRSIAALEEARSKMKGVDYIFLDEISMVSCQDLYLIDCQLKEITLLDDLPFGGMNMVVAGDFAQLPPAKGQTLYSGQVAKEQHSRQCQADQENTLGLLVWHQFVVVVILKQNMRQQSSGAADASLRGALDRMRYKDCSLEDIAFLRTLIPSHNPALNLADAIWKDVSVITALNVHKDQINVMNARRFAVERNTHLQYFYSVDKQVRTPASVKLPNKSSSGDSRGVKLTENVQRLLWTSHPYSSDHIPGRLALCKGMPVMIRYNEATELCVTKGQEAIVKGWTSRDHPQYPGHLVLDVLFVELVRPPKPVQIPYLPVNVVPLTKITSSIKAVLPNDLTLNLSRQQVPVLLNFSMTDYASQGKTRDVNIVDLKHCRNHQAMYTCLSRGRFADRTVILRDFDVRKITGGLSGFLREEFRSLALLDKITEARYSGKLPSGVVQRLRASTIVAFREWCRSCGDLARPLSRSVDEIRLGDGVSRKRSCPVSTGDVMANEAHIVTNKRHRLDAAADMHDRLGTWVDSWRWDGIDWSCAYDSVLTVLRSAWSRRPASFSAGVEGSWLRRLGRLFRTLDDGRSTLPDVRFQIRKHLWARDSRLFPRGRVGTDLFTLVRTFVGADTAVSADTSVCDTCGEGCPGFLFERMSVYTVMRSDLAESTRVSDYLRGLHATNGSCGRCGGNVRLSNETPSLLCVQLPRVWLGATEEHRLIIDKTFAVGHGRYELAGVVYWGADDEHFAARVVRSVEEVYRYDGMMADGRLTFDRDVGSRSVDRVPSVMDRRVASLAIYWMS